MKIKKSLGQNFLVSEEIINKIVDSVKATSEDLIIEIGPGRGALTKKLITKNSQVLAYEIDNDLISNLKILENEKVKIKHEDFLKANIKEDIKNISYKNLFIVGNLPYYITTPIIEKIIDENLNLTSLTIMVQKEVGERFMGEPKSKDYGYFTCVLKYYFVIEKITLVPNTAFYPRPKVNSVVLKLIPREDKSDVDFNKYREFLKQVFRQKRKTLKNNLYGENWEKIKTVLDKYNLPESVRAEELPEEILIAIFKIISK